MKLIFVLAAVTLAQADKLDRAYLPPNAQGSAGSGNFLQTPSYSPNGFQGQNNHAYSSVSVTNSYGQSPYTGVEARPERPQAALERTAAILRQDSSNDGETYSYAYETQNGIRAEEKGVATHGVMAQGGYAYTGDDGVHYSVSYTADQNGFVPQGEHLPTPPPIPAEILKALEQNARDEAAGIFDDGTYSEGKYSGSSEQQQYNLNAQPINYNSAAIGKSYLPPQNNNQRNGY